ncbi:MAG: ABC transporter substrate-binding protein [Hyphomonadaceae bacterium]
MVYRALVFAVLLTACGGERPLPSPRFDAEAPAKPTRIVSLDFCADQYVLKLVDRSNILALSPEAVMAHSYLRDEAGDLPSVRPLAEDAIALQPDLIVRSYGGGPNAESFFEQAGIPVLTVGWAGDFDAIKAVTRDMAAGLGQPERGAVLVAEIDARLAALPAQATGEDKSVLYMTPTGVTTGAGSLIDELLDVAGLTNFETRAGWHALPLERLTSEQPDLVAASFFDSTALSHNIWSAARHPVARQQMTSLPTAELAGAWTACGAWFALDAAEALARGGTTP